jgi:hypothetical protein
VVVHNQSSAQIAVPPYTDGSSQPQNSPGSVSTGGCDHFRIGVGVGVGVSVGVSVEVGVSVGVGVGLGVGVRVGVGVGVGVSVGVSVGVGVGPICGQSQRIALCRMIPTSPVQSDPLSSS